MTIPNSLPLPPSTVTSSDIARDDKEDSEKRILSPCSPCLSEDLTLIVTTPSSITEHPLLPPVDAASAQCNPKRAWYKQLRPPYAMLLISCVQVGLYASLDEALNTRAMHALLFDPLKQVEPWRFVTYMFLHKDSVHLLQNVLLQCLFGVYLETFEGNWKILFVYLGGGIGGALGAAAICGDLIVGASAGVYALLLSYLSHIILNFTAIKYRIHLIISVAVIIISDIVYCTLHYLYNASPTISGGAHLFGALHGLLIGLLLFSHATNNYYNKNYNKIVFAIATAILFIIICSLIIADIKSTRQLMLRKLSRTLKTRDFQSD